MLKLHFRNINSWKRYKKKVIAFQPFFSGQVLKLLGVQNLYGALTTNLVLDKKSGPCVCDLDGCHCCFLPRQPLVPFSSRASLILYGHSLPISSLHWAQRGWQSFEPLSCSRSCPFRFVLLATASCASFQAFPIRRRAFLKSEVCKQK